MLNKFSNQSGSIFIKAGILIIIVMILIVALSLLILPRAEPYLLQKGFEMAQKKCLAMLPPQENYNPQVHQHDPLEIEMGFEALRDIIPIDTFRTEEFLKHTSAFMITFRDIYNDQTIMPEELNTMIDSLASLQRKFLQTHFVKTAKFLMFRLEKADALEPYISEVLGFDSIAIFNVDIKLGINGPLSIFMIRQMHDAMKDENFTSTEIDSLKSITKNIERFQIYSEILGVTKSLYATAEFTSFAYNDQLMENMRIIFKAMRNMQFDYDPIKPTLRSYILMWREQRTDDTPETYDLTPFYEFSKYAASHIKTQEPEN